LISARLRSGAGVFSNVLTLHTGQQNLAVYFNNNLHLPDFMNRALLIYFYLLLFAPVLAFAGGNKPVSANMRERINFNAGWKFHLLMT